jgi:hypothetical protein
MFENTMDFVWSTGDVPCIEIKDRIQNIFTIVKKLRFSIYLLILFVFVSIHCNIKYKSFKLLCIQIQCIIRYTV